MTSHRVFPPYATHRGSGKFLGGTALVARRSKESLECLGSPAAMSAAKSLDVSLIVSAVPRQRDACRGLSLEKFEK